ncbi:MAG TPA: NADPH:quinone reductase [Streptosporangiaceae bacterium]|nr:NADPH:quinone reductase [Streptosporangiaceae bacterium]
MKAAVYDRPGPAAEVLRVAEIERPEPGPGEVRVRVSVSGINPTDVKSRAGVTPRPIDGFQIPHQDGAGVIDAVGPGGPADRIGQRVWMYLAAAGRRWGTAAEWTVVPENHAVPLPDGVSMELAASLGVPALTAHHLVFADGPVKDATVLVAGGAGAVGHFSLEFAAWGGAARLASTVSGPAKAELARLAGAGHVVNYTDADAASQITAAVGPVDRIIEVALGANLRLDLAISRPGTVLACYAAEPNDPVLPVRACMTASIVLRFMLLYTLPRAALDQGVADVGTALRAGALTELPERRFPLDEIVAAHEAVEQGVSGKVLVIP